MASGTDGNIISYDVNGDPVAVATGSAGKILLQVQVRLLLLLHLHQYPLLKYSSWGQL